MTNKNTDNNKPNECSPSSTGMIVQMTYPRLTKKDICLRKWAEALMGQIGVEARKILFSGVEEPAKEHGCFCLLCDRPYSPYRRPGRFLVLTKQPSGEPIGLSAICKPCLGEFATDDELWRAIYDAVPGSP